MADFTSVGGTLNLDAPGKLRGVTKYAGDLRMANMLHGLSVLTPAPRVLVRSIDVSGALALPGVVVMTAADVPGANRFGYGKRDQPVLVGVGEETRFVGDAVAVIAAETLELAREARRRIKVQYDELRAISSIREALSESAPRIHEDAADNICSQGELNMGDVDQGFAQADVIVEETIFTPRQEHAYLEPEAAMAYLDDQGRVVLLSGVQDPQYFAYDVAHAVGLPANRLRVVATPLGGGFGGKDDITLQAHAVLLAVKTGRPVRVAYSREESFLVHPKRHPMQIRVKIGAIRFGLITALEADFLSDAGPYAGRSPVVLTIALHSMSGPYAISNLRLQGKSVFTNNLASGACRGYGQPQAAAAREMVIDLLASDLGMDPIQLRKLNSLREGQKAGTLLVNVDSPPSLIQVIDTALERAGDPIPARPGRKAGRGLACAMPLFDIGALPSLGMAGVSVGVELMVDGSVVVRSSAVDMGQGVRSVLAMMAAEEFGVKAESVSVLLADTDSSPKSGPTTGSRQTYVSGNALLMAIHDLKERLLVEAAEKLDTGVEHLIFKEGAVRALDDESKAYPLGDLARQLYYEGVNLREESWFKATQAVIGHTFSATVADVEVDPDTGDVKVCRLVTCDDVGKAINPTAVRGQLIGGSMQGLGWALCEEMVQVEGKVVTPSLSEYIVPTSLDAPCVEGVLVENAYPSGPFGAKGVGEHATVTTAPAILNAIYQATGALIRDFPATPEKVAAALGAFADAGEAKSG